MNHQWLLIVAVMSLLHSNLVQCVKDTEIQHLSTTFTNFLRKHVKHDLIEQELNKIQYTTMDVNSSDLVTGFTKGMQQLLQEKVKVVDAIKTSVENLRINFTRNNRYSETVKEFDYYNMRDIENEEDLKITNSFTEDFKVDLNHSFVQVPTNIYKFKQSVLQQVQWSKELDKGFKENFADGNKDLQYQYYGDASGNIQVASSPSGQNRQNKKSEGVRFC